MKAPVFGVVIGDSIAEGHPALHGRLHPGQPQFDPVYPDAPGQLSYELGRMSGMRWYNHGIGSQTTQMIWERWQRDLLGTIYDPHDGRGNETLPGRPFAAVVVTGANDSCAVGPEPTIALLRSMRESVQQAGIMTCFLTVTPSERYVPDKLRMVQQINDWMRQHLPAPGVKVADLYAWIEDPQAPGKPNREWTADYIHPSQEGYRQVAALVWEEIKEWFL